MCQFPANVMVLHAEVELSTNLREVSQCPVYVLKPDLRRVGDHGDFQLKFLVFEHYASLK